MFSQDVTNSDEFLDMPLSSQSLYFHLGINADDDGFVQPKRIMRMVEAKSDDLKVLKAKGFIIEFEKSVIVITHWKINNKIRSDRKQNTIYQEHLKTLGVTNTDVYRVATKRQPNVNQVSPKCRHRLGKDRIGEVSIVSEQSSKNDTDKIIDVFYQSINPTINWGNKTTRKACKDLIDRFSLEPTIKMAEQICSVQGKDKYAPVATTPYQMKEKLAQFKIYFENNNNSTKITEI